MKKQHLILITAGVVLAVLLLSKKGKNTSEPVSVIAPGDKGNEVLGLQKALTNLTGIKLGNMGVYDNETLSAVQYFLKDSYHLYDYERGYVDKKFASDLYQLANSEKKI